MTPLRFLTSNGNLTGARSLLVIQSGPAELLVELIARVRQTYPEASLSVLLQRGIADALVALPEPGAVEYLENMGSRAEQVRRLRARGFDGVFVMYSDHPGYWKLKLLPFLLGAGSVLAVNEHLGWFPVALQDLHRLGGHLVRRLGTGSVSLRGPARRVALAATAPALLGYLLAYERLAGLRARLRGSAPTWKRGKPAGPGRQDD